MMVPRVINGIDQYNLFLKFLINSAVKEDMKYKEVANGPNTQNIKIFNSPYDNPDS